MKLKSELSYHLTTFCVTCDIGFPLSRIGIFVNPQVS